MCESYLADVHEPILNLIAAETGLPWEINLVLVLKVGVVQVVQQPLFQHTRCLQRIHISPLLWENPSQFVLGRIIELIRVEMSDLTADLPRKVFIVDGLALWPLL
jgi:hypothetical protein